MAAYSAFLRGASKIYVVDKVPERLAAAKKIAGCIPVDFSAGEDAVDVIIRENDGKMVDRSIDAVGYQAVGSGKEAGEVPNVVLEQCIKVTRPTGGIGVPGLYVPSDPGAVDEKSSQGMVRTFPSDCSSPVLKPKLHDILWEQEDPSTPHDSFHNLGSWFEEVILTRNSA